MKLHKIVVVYTIPRAAEQRMSLETVKKTLKNMGIKFSLANRDKLNRSMFEGIDLAIAVGGDGTFLRAAQFIKKELLFGVNADVKNKEGFFMKSNRRNFRSTLKRIIEDKMKVKKFSRLEAKIDGKKIDSYALNEFFIGPSKPYHASKYIIKNEGHKERQKSSGILVSTPAGSFAWAGASRGHRMQLNSRNFHFVVREPYEGKVFKDYKLKRGILKPHKKITIISEMLDGMLVADSVGKEFKVKNGQKIEISISKNYLHAFWGIK